MSYVFVSYSHSDSGYAQQLAKDIEQRRIPVWIDERIDYGSEWPSVIERQLDGCAAFVLVMTPSARQSTWVQNELARAQRKNKPIFPLLLQGDEPWLSVEALQYVDVRDGSMPTDSFHSSLLAFLQSSNQVHVPVYEADFQVDLNQWPETKTPKYKAFSQGDCYHIHLSSGKYERYQYSTIELSDFRASVDSQFLSTNDNDAQCGMVFRLSKSDSIDPYYSNDSYYRFSISRKGQYALHANSGGEWTTIIDYMKSSVIRTTGEFNILSVQMNNTTIVLEVNGVKVKSLDDYRLLSGKVGIFAAAMTNGLCAEARFRNFRIYSP